MDDLDSRLDALGDSDSLFEALDGYDFLPRRLARLRSAPLIEKLEAATLHTIRAADIVASFSRKFLAEESIDDDLNLCDAFRISFRIAEEMLDDTDVQYYLFREEVKACWDGEWDGHAGPTYHQIAVRQIHGWLSLMSFDKDDDLAERVKQFSEHLINSVDVNARYHLFDWNHVHELRTEIEREGMAAVKEARQAQTRNGTADQSLPGDADKKNSNNSANKSQTKPTTPPPDELTLELAAYLILNRGKHRSINATADRFVAEYKDKHNEECPSKANVLLETLRRKKKEGHFAYLLGE